LPVIRFKSIGAAQNDPCLNRHKGPLALEVDVLAQTAAQGDAAIHAPGIECRQPNIREVEDGNRVRGGFTVLLPNARATCASGRARSVEVAFCTFGS
jgi:hypothetical protein